MTAATEAVQATWTATLERQRQKDLEIAEAALAAAERYLHSRRSGEANSVAVYCRRGMDALKSVESIDVLLDLGAPRRAALDPEPRRATL